MDTGTDNQWQTKLKNIQERVDTLFQRQPFSDVRFRIEKRRDEQTMEVQYFNAHKLILSASSSVFAAQFYNTDQTPDHETYGDNDADYRITDVAHKAFENMLMYIYQEKAAFETPVLALKTYYVAKKYKISHLQGFCSQHLSTVPLTPEDAMDILEDPLNAEINGLRQRCMDIAESKPLEVIRIAAEYGKPETLEAFLQMERLAVPSELPLFQAMVEGGRIRCHRATEPAMSSGHLKVFLKRFLKYIRFLTMNPQEFTLAFEMSSDAISKEEGFAILFALCHPGSRNFALPSWCCQNTRSRISQARNVSELQILPVNLVFGDYVPGEPNRNLISSLDIKVFGGNYVFTGVALRFRRIIDEPNVAPALFEAERGNIPSTRYTLNIRNSATAIAFEQVKYLQVDRNNIVIQFPIPLPVFDGQEAKVSIMLDNPVGLDFARFNAKNIKSAENAPRFELTLNNYRIHDNTFSIAKIFYTS